MINFATQFEQFEKGVINQQKKLPIESPLSVYYGITSEKLLRLSFISTIRPFEIESTKEIKVTQGKENEDVYWTCFDLLNDEAKTVFFSFCESLVESIVNENDESKALNNLKGRYYAWKLLLKNKGKMPYELYQGLYGELYFLVEKLSNQVSVDKAVSAWVGPDGYSKDFSLGNDWFEVKTIGTSSTSIKINSLAQLDSDVDGHLVVVIVERMSEQFDNDLCNVHQLYEMILNNLSNNVIKEEFVNKVLKYGYYDEDNSLNNHKYEVKRIKFYKVDKNFPKLTRDSINNTAISNVSYEIMINSIESFKENDRWILMSIEIII